MTAPKLEQFSNGGETLLNGGIDGSVTSLVVDDASQFPSTGNFRIVIDSEILLVTAVSGTTFTVVRAQESTAGVSHSDNAPVSHVLTTGGMDRWGMDNIPNFGYGPGYGLIVDDAGTTVLTESSFTWVNQGGAAATDQNGTILMRIPTSAGVNLRGKDLAAPSAPYAYIGAFQLCLPRAGSDDVCMCMMGFREAATNEAVTFICGTNADEAFKVGVQNYTNNTTSSTQIRALQACNLFGSVLWLKIEDNNTNLIFYVGMDGINWIQIHSVSRTALMGSGPDRVFWGGVNNSNGGCETLVRLMHWSRES